MCVCKRIIIICIIRNIYFVFPPLPFTAYHHR